MERNERPDLPKMKRISIPDNAFYSTRILEMSNMNSLESIEIGESCFGIVSSFSLRGENEGENRVTRVTFP